MGSVWRLGAPSVAASTASLGPEWTQSVSFLSQLERAGSLTVFLFGLHPTVP